jgi:hypothetical protein
MRVADEFPELRVGVVNDTVVLSGRFPIKGNNGVLDSYQIEVRVPPDFPASIPSLRETAGRIPMLADRHMTPDTGEACPILPEEWLLDPQAGSIVSFLQGPVTNFFMGQSLVEAGEAWPFGERAHGRAGRIEYFAERFGAKDERAVLGYLECLSRDHLKGHWQGPCGSGKRLRDCHLDELRELKKRVPCRVAVLAHRSIQNVAGNRRPH